MIRFLMFTAILAAGTLSTAMAHEVHDPQTLDKPAIKNLMKSALEGATGLEVIVSHVALPPNFTLPKHWHPGEEFAYILQGSITLILEGQNDSEIVQGETGMVPLKQIHTARSGSQGATILVFRVHEQGQPDRIPAK